MLIWGVWRAVRFMLDENTQNKVQFINSEELSEHFDAATLPREIGGEWDSPEPLIDLWDPEFDRTGTLLLFFAQLRTLMAFLPEYEAPTDEVLEDFPPLQ